MPLNTKDYSLSRWVLQSVFALGFVVVLAAVAIHAAAGVAWGKLALAGAVVFLIQAAAVTTCFWARNYWRRTADLRPLFAVSGLYGIAMIPTLEYYASRWGLITRQNTVQDAAIFAFITLGWIVFLSWWRWRAKKA